MKRISTIFLQAVIVLIGIAVLAVMIRVPATEGRATNLNAFQIYSDPFILYGYATSIAFFIGLYKMFRLLGYIGQNKVFSPNAVAALKSIKYCAIVFSILIVTAALFIMFSHNAQEEDSAGFMAICIITTFASVVVATAAAIFEKILQNAIDLKSENDLTI